MKYCYFYALYFIFAIYHLFYHIFTQDYNNLFFYSPILYSLRLLSFILIPNIFLYLLIPINQFIDSFSIYAHFIFIRFFPS